MDREQVKKVVHATLALFSRIAKRTRTQADDLLMALLQAKEEQLINAVMVILAETNETPTDEQVVRALEQVGIRV
jgi:hypothetical protein